MHSCATFRLMLRWFFQFIVLLAICSGGALAQSTEPAQTDLLGPRRSGGAPELPPDRAQAAAAARRHGSHATAAAEGAAALIGADFRAARDQGRGQHRARRSLDPEDRRPLYRQAGLGRRPRGNSPPADAPLHQSGLYQLRLHDTRPERRERCRRLPRGRGAGHPDRRVRNKSLRPGIISRRGWSRGWPSPSMSPIWNASSRSCCKIRWCSASI